ncbi:putative FBD-associated F-box protein At5g56390 [Capsella rubella]|nr:putative FBD-associated F-box protein At5g56390 [Capsella rubella]
MKYPNDEFVNRLISSCRVLEDLVVEQILDDNVVMLSVRVPSLKSLVLHQKLKKGKASGFILDTPALEFLDVVEYSQGSHIVENVMPNIVKANVDIFHSQTEQILGSITLAKYLHLCLPSSKSKNVSYPHGSIFKLLVYLKICTCLAEWLSLLMRMLRNSPNLQVLEIEQVHCLRNDQSRPCWSEPSSIPNCLLYSLETFKWECYTQRIEEKEMAAFILRSAICLKKATIIPSKSIDDDKKLEMHKELSLLPRYSPICQLAFS